MKLLLNGFGNTVEGHFLRFYGHTATQFAYTFTNNRRAFFDPGVYYVQVICGAFYANSLGNHCCIFGNGINECFFLLLKSGFLWHHQGIFINDGYLYGTAVAVREQSFFVGELCADRYRTRIAVDLGIDGLDFPLLGIFPAVGKNERNRGGVLNFFFLGTALGILQKIEILFFR